MRIDIDSYREVLDTLTRNKSRSFLTGFGVFWGVFMLVAKPAKFSLSFSFRPLPPPMSATSMKTPQNTPKPVSNERLLLRVKVSSTSLYESISILIFY